MAGISWLTVFCLCLQTICSGFSSLGFNSTFSYSSSMLWLSFAFLALDLVVIWLQKCSSPRSSGPMENSWSSRVFSYRNRGFPILSFAGRFMGICLPVFYPGIIVSLKDSINDNLESNNAYKEKVDRTSVLSIFALWTSCSSSDQNLGKYTCSQSSIHHMFI